MKREVNYTLDPTINLNNFVPHTERETLIQKIQTLIDNDREGQITAQSIVYLLKTNKI